MGPLAESPLIRQPLKHLRAPALAALSVLLFALIACSDSENQEVESTSPTGGSQTPTAIPPSTIDADFNSARALEHARQLSVVIGTRAAGSDGEARAAEYIRNQLEE